MSSTLSIFLCSCMIQIKRFDRVKVLHIHVVVLRFNVLEHYWYCDIHGFNLNINQIRGIKRVEMRKMYIISRNTS